MRMSIEKLNGKTGNQDDIYSCLSWQKPEAIICVEADPELREQSKEINLLVFQVIG